MGKPAGNKGHYKGLSRPQKMFVDEYIKGSTLEKCVEKAGYIQKHPRKYGEYLLNLQPIKQEIEKRTTQITKNAGITKEKQLKRLDDLVNQFQQLLDLINTRPEDRDEGTQKQIQELKSIFKLKDIERILDQQNRLIGLYTADQLEVTHSIRVDLIGDDNNGPEEINIEDQDPDIE